ncbi:MAG: DUF971 domain-containing protein [Bryobacteraceae bacterium]|nr:DUF971 domain-containing protein [Bryobacteraceae bacterium]
MPGKAQNPAEFEPEHIAISKSRGVKIDWKDGHRSEYPLALLRDECPCATCTGAHGTPPQKSNYSNSSSDPFPIFKPALKMLSVEEVGNYALRIHWNDGHQTGIYTWEFFRRLCPCPECRNKSL